MNCQEVLNRTYLYLDCELTEQDLEAVTQHLDACIRCAETYQVEQDAWARVRGLLASDQIPDDVRSSFLAKLDAVDRSPNAFSHPESRAALRSAQGPSPWVRWGLPAAAAAILLVAFFKSGIFDAQPKPHLHDHGATVAAAASNFSSLNWEKASVSEEFLLENANCKLIDSSELPAVFEEIFGSGCDKLMGCLCPKTTKAFRRQVKLENHEAMNCLLQDETHRIAMYVMDRKSADLKDLRHIKDGVSQDIQIHECKTCCVVTIARGDKVVLLVTRPKSESRRIVEALVAMY